MSNNVSGRIAKNTAILFFRMLITMGVSLYASRVILHALGVTDFGLYNVVGSIVIVLSFINNSLSGAVSRFLTYELGKGDHYALRKVFSAALTIHVCAAVGVLIVAETIGLWVLETKLNIPSDRLWAARIAYQLSIFGGMLNVIQVPYNAVIISHERMQAFAYFSLFQNFAKLAIAFSLLNWMGDRLALYSLLMLGVMLVVTVAYVVYCNAKFSECTFRLTNEKEFLFPIMSFSGYDLYGNLCWIASTQGMNILLNIQYGPKMNAASGIASQVQSAVFGFSGNFLTAIRPQIVKSYASNEIIRFQKLVNYASKYAYLLMLIVSLPLIIECEYILRVWLTVLPKYSVEFCQLALILGLITALFSPIWFGIHATGNIKKISFYTGSINLLALPLAYVFVKLGFPPTMTYVGSVCVALVANIYNIFVLKEEVSQFSVRRFIKTCIGSCLFVTVLSVAAPFLIHNSFNEGLGRLVAVVFASSAIIVVLIYYFVLEEDLKYRFNALLKSGRISK